MKYTGLSMIDPNGSLPAIPDSLPKAIPSFGMSMIDPKGARSRPLIKFPRTVPGDNVKPEQSELLVDNKTIVISKDQKFAEYIRNKFSRNRKSERDQGTKVAEGRIPEPIAGK